MNLTTLPLRVVTGGGEMSGTTEVGGVLLVGRGEEGGVGDAEGEGAGGGEAGEGEGVGEEG